MTLSELKAAYRRKLATNPDGEIVLDTVEISHPDMTMVYRLVNDHDQLTAKTESGETVTFQPEQMTIANAANNADMSQQATVTIADALNILDDELSRIRPDTADPTITFRRYLLSDTSSPASGPVTYQAQSVTQSKGVFTVNCGLPKLNNRGTGLIANPKDIPLLRGILA